MPPKGQKLDLNTCTREDLKQIQGVGDYMAESIIQYRDEHGGFDSIEELRNVYNLKDPMFEKIRSQARV